MVCTTNPLPSIPDNHTHITLSFSLITEKYSLSNRHRKPHATSKKSIWTISTDLEVQLFESSIEKEYTNKTVDLSWEFYTTTIGQDVNGAYVTLARFDRRNQTSKEWHGYPIDYSKDANNRPTPSVLKKWLDENRITKNEYKKIQQGRKGAL